MTKAQPKRSTKAPKKAKGVVVVDLRKKSAQAPPKRGRPPKAASTARGLRVPTKRKK